MSTDTIPDTTPAAGHVAGPDPEIARALADISQQIPTDGELLILPLDRVRSSPLNPRKRFDEGYIAELAMSLQDHGQLQPIVVRREPIEAQLSNSSLIELYDYVIVVGECRWRAARIAGMATIEAKVRHDIVTDQQHLELALIENLRRRDIDAIEEAYGYKALADMGVKQSEICARVNRSQAAVSNAMRLLKLPQDVQDLVVSKTLGVSHALAIVRYAEFPAVASAIAGYAVANNTPSKSLEKDTDLWNLWYDLKRRKLIVDVGRSDWEKACNSCPFNAFIKLNNSAGGRCLKPAHHAELEAADRAIQEAKIAKQTEALRKRAENDKRLTDRLGKIDHAGVGPSAQVKALHLKDMAYNTYDRIMSEDVEGCSIECPCRTIALNERNEPCRVCIDPGRRNAMKGQATKQRKKQLRALAETNIAAWRADPVDFSPDAFCTRRDRALAQCAWREIRNTSTDVKRAAAKLLPDDDPIKPLLTISGYEVKDRDAWEILCLESDERILSLIGELNIRHEAKDRIEGGSTNMVFEKADFLLKGPKRKAKRAEGAPLERFIDCPSCKGLMTLKSTGNGPTKVTRYECGCGHCVPVVIGVDLAQGEDETVETFKCSKCGRTSFWEGVCERCEPKTAEFAAVDAH